MIPRVGARSPMRRAGAGVDLGSATRVLEQSSEIGKLKSSWRHDSEGYGTTVFVSGQGVPLAAGGKRWFEALSPESGNACQERSEAPGFTPGEPPAVRPDGGFYVSHVSSLEAFDAQGNSLWKKELSDGLETRAVSDRAGNCYICDHDRLYSVSPEGRVRWSKPVTNGWSPPVVAADQTIVVAERNGTVRAFTAAGEQHWTFSGVKGQDPDFPTVKTELAPAPDGRMLFGSADGNVYCLSPHGRELWRQPTGADKLEKYDTPTVDDQGVSYLAGGQDKHEVVAFDRDGEFLWRQELGPILHLTALPGGGVAVGIRGGPLHGVDRDSRHLWTLDEGNTYSKPIFGAQGELYTSTSGRYLFRVDLPGPLSHLERALLEGAPDAGPEIEKGDGWVRIGAVRLPVR
ncbi:MAG: PQQ-like beta-propeller repeat protein [Armatimonadetes bacterium]|nr:PQQ-like beta-propeller repeat protein [Armatimonadota bacterium]